jgi:hypothetical protein
MTRLTLTPLKAYAAPDYPNRPEVDAHPELLRHLPRRWQGNAVLLAVLAGAGLATVGIGAAQAVEKAKIVARLAPLFPISEGRPQLAGKVAAPVLLTEADARAIILDEAKKAGVSFVPDALAVERVRLPKNAVQARRNEEMAQIDLTLDGTDAKRKISYEFVSEADVKGWSAQQFSGCTWGTREAAVALRDGLAQKLPEGTTALFYDTGLGNADELRLQVRDFIAWLKAEGVI